MLLATATTSPKCSKNRPAYRAGYMREVEYHPFVVETGGRLGSAACDLLYLIARQYEGKRLNIPTPAKLTKIGGHFLGSLRILISSTLQRALSRRMLAIADSRFLSPLVCDSTSLQAFDDADFLAGLFPLG